MPDSPDLGRPDPPPPLPMPMPMMFAGFALAFQVATVIVLVADRGDIATILGIIALVFSAGTFFLLLGRGGRGGSRSTLTAEEKARIEGRTTGPAANTSDYDDRGPYGPTRR